MSLINIVGRTRKEQNLRDRQDTEKGSLWGEMKLLNQYVFTHEEFEAIRLARKILSSFDKKVKCLKL